MSILHHRTIQVDPTPAVVARIKTCPSRVSSLLPIFCTFCTSLHCPTRLVRVVHFSLLQMTCLLAWSRRVARWHIKRGVLQKEIPRSQEHGHGLCRHHGIILWRWKMRDAKCVPEYNIRILDVFVRMLSNPFGQTSRWFTRRLGDMAPSRMDLVVLV